MHFLTFALKDRFIAKHRTFDGSFSFLPPYVLLNYNAATRTTPKPTAHQQKRRNQKDILLITNRSQWLVTHRLTPPLIVGLQEPASVTDSWSRRGRDSD